MIWISPARTIGLVLCDSLIVGLGATGYASARSLFAVRRSTGTASGTRIFSCNAALAVCLAFATTSLSASEWKLPLKVSVDAGKYSRQDCPVAIQFDRPLPENVDWKLRELTADTAREVPAQIDAADRRRVWWLLSGETPAGKVRQFEFQPGAPERTTEMAVDQQDDSVTFRAGDHPILRYRTRHVTPPAGIDARFGRSAYIHPVWTPKGAIVTDEFPPDHAHQSGIFLAYTKAVFEGRPTNFWEIKDEKGRVRFKSVQDTMSGPVYGLPRVAQEHVDLTVPGGKVALNETWDVRAWHTDGPRAGFWIVDVESTLTCATTSPLRLPTYHYGGFAVRGARTWTRDATSFLTSDRHDRMNGNHTRPKWSDLTGPVVNGEPAGIAILTHPTNFRFPEPVRIHPSMPYFVYTPSPLGDWSIEPEQPHVSRYRIIVHDGPPNADRLQQLWQDFAEPPRVIASK